MRSTEKEGECRECGAKLVDWKRIHQKNREDAEYTFEVMKYEMIRHKFWHVEINQRAINYAKRKGVKGLIEAVPKRLKTSVGKAADGFDGRQTRLEDSPNPIHFAQHATASCCRKCIAYWHDIPTNRSLTKKEIEYLSDIAMMYLLERLPQLTENGEKVAPIRKKKKKSGK
jgi:hypothetical protein